MPFKSFFKKIFGHFLAKCLHMAWEYVDSNALLRRGTYLGNSRVLTSTVDGHLMFLNAKDISITPYIFAHGIYEEAITAYYRKVLTPGMHIVEVGGNVGYFSILAAKLVGAQGHVYTFEPDVHTFAFLQDNIDLNSYHARVTAYNYAVGDVIGTAILTQPSKHPGSGSIMKLPPDFLERRFDDARSHDVNVTTLDAMLFANDIDKIDVLKMDAEGSELAVLRGAPKLLKGNPHMKIICEYNPELLEANAISGTDFLRELGKYGFVAHTITKEGLEVFDPQTVPHTSVVDILLTRTV